MTMQSTGILRQLAQEREATLRATSPSVMDEHRRRIVRRWVGRQLVRFGSRLANEPTMRPVRAP